MIGCFGKFWTVSTEDTSITSQRHHVLDDFEDDSAAATGGEDNFAFEEVGKESIGRGNDWVDDGFGGGHGEGLM